MLLARPEPPPLSITVLRYEKELAGHITAHLVVTNTGLDPVCIVRSRSAIALLTRDGWVTNRPGAFTMLAAGELNPGASSIEQVTLVSGIGAWKIGYEARTPSPRATLFNRLPAKLRTSAFAMGAVREWISDEEAEAQMVWSRIFNAQEWFDARAELEYLNAPLHKVFPPSKS